jgi:oligopeptide transport system substrate-binding protein
MQRRIRPFIFFLFLLCILFTGNILSPSVLLAQEDQSEERILSISMFPANIQLNPLRTYSSTEAQIYTALYEGLVTPDPITLRPIPGVAESWEISEDGTEYRFFIRKNAHFSNGDRISAEDAVNSFLAHLNPEENSSFSSFLDLIVGARDYRQGKATREKRCNNSRI